MKKSLYKLTLTALLVAFGVIGGSMFEFTIGVAKVAPMQHLINVISAVLVGPWFALIQAFLTSLIRNILGTGTILAFPGSMIGAVVAGLLFAKFKTLISAVLGELFGTGILGALASYPIAALFMGTKGALWVFIPSFFLSALVGVTIGYVILKSIWRAVILPQLNKARSSK